MLKAVLDQLTVRRCTLCKDSFVEPDRSYVCKVCESYMKIDFEDAQKETQPKIFFATYYMNQARDLMRRLKYKEPKLAKFWANFLADFWQDYYENIIFENLPAKQMLDLERQSKTYVAAVPLAKERQKERGFNQSDLIAKEFTKKMFWQRYQYLPKLLLRGKETPSLFDKSKSEREEIMQNAFKLNGKYLRKLRDSKTCKRLIIIDDICTTGTTLIEAAKTIKEMQVFDELFLLAVTGNKL